MQVLFVRNVYSCEATSVGVGLSVSVISDIPIFIGFFSEGSVPLVYMKMYFVRLAPYPVWSRLIRKEAPYRRNIILRKLVLSFSSAYSHSRLMTVNVMLMPGHSRLMTVNVMCASSHSRLMTVNDDVSILA